MYSNRYCFDGFYKTDFPFFLMLSACTVFSKSNTLPIAPGAILTPMVAEAFKQVNPADPKAAETTYAQRNPTRHLGKPEDVGNLVAFLLSDECQYVNGQTIAIDGGESNLYGNS